MRDLINLIARSEDTSLEIEINRLVEGIDQMIEAQPPVVEPVQAEPVEQQFANTAQNKQIIPILFDGFVKLGVIPPDADMTEVFKEDHSKSRMSHIRTTGITTEQLLQVTTAYGLKEQPLTDEQMACSGQFSIYSFLLPTQLTITVVLAGRKKGAQAAGAASDLVLNRKDLTPVKLGLDGTYNNRRELADSTKKAVNSVIKNTNIAKALTELVDIAMNRGSGQLTPESLQYVMSVRGMISQDFGEILAPLALAGDDDAINFPSGNEKLIDVTVGGKVRYSVKALGGSGTSMNSLGALLDEYDATLTDEGKKTMFRNSIKVWQTASRKEGKVVDRICYAASLNQTPEYLSYVNILGGEFKDFSALKSLLKPLVSDAEYPEFLKMILPATQAGQWGINVGMPDDSNYYLGNTDKKPAVGIAGKRSYDADHVDGAANIITYSLGKGFEFMVKRGPDSQQYKDIMNDMIRQLNCQLGHVDITQDGKLAITSKPFGNLNFVFDYHAPSHIAGNNRPGFMIVPPNKGDKGKKKSDSDIPASPSVSDEPLEPALKLKAPGASMSADKITRPGRRPETRSAAKGLGRERR